MTDSIKTGKFDSGEIVIYSSDGGQDAVEVRLADETVWLSQAQMVALFERDQSVISRHLNNVFKEGELARESNMQKMHIANSDKPVAFYNLDVIISIGYRVKSKRGTQFRIWATSILKEHLIQGYTYNRRRLAEKGIEEAQQVLRLLSTTLESHELVSDEGRSILAVINNYAKTWKLLLQYDEQTLSLPKSNNVETTPFDIREIQEAIGSLKRDLFARGEATDIFGAERGDGLEAILGAVFQTFDGHDLYPGIEEKAAHLLYFIVKDHPVYRW